MKQSSTLFWTLKKKKRKVDKNNFLKWKFLLKGGSFGWKIVFRSLFDLLGVKSWNIKSHLVNALYIFFLFVLGTRKGRTTNVKQSPTLFWTPKTKIKKQEKIYWEKGVIFWWVIVPRLLFVLFDYFSKIYQSFTCFAWSMHWKFLWLIACDL